MRWGIGIHHERGRRCACRGRGRDRGYVGGIGTMTAPFFPYICIGLDAQDVQDMCPGGHKNKVCNVNAAAWHFSFLEIQSSVTEN
jgi:hypothetical protein